MCYVTGKFGLTAAFATQGGRIGERPPNPRDERLVVCVCEFLFFSFLERTNTNRETTIRPIGRVDFFSKRWRQPGQWY